MLNYIFRRELRADPEFQQAWIRLAIWLFAITYIGVGGASEHYQVEEVYFFSLFGFFFALFMGLLLSVVRRPGWKARRYISLVVDIGATTFCLFLTKDAVSPFVLLYIWIFVSYGIRYGLSYLKAASVLSIVAYALVLFSIDGWQSRVFEVFFLFMALLILPFYQKTLLRRLHDSHKAAEIASQVKSDFISSMTHELRTPLSGILGMAQLLESTRLTPEQTEYATSIHSSARHLGALIHDVLDMSKIESGELRLENEKLDLHRLLHEVCAALSAQALDKELELICWVDSGLPTQIIGDELRLRQILFNLVGNAVKFTQRGEVLVRASLKSDQGRPQIYLEVKDTGIGIPEIFLHRVFERFWQANGDALAQQGGTGLGTAIAHDLVRLMGGAIGVSSVEGQGSLFWVRLPLITDEVPADPRSAHLGLVGRRVLVYEANETSRGAIMDACQAIGVQSFPVTSLTSLKEVIASARGDGALDLVIIADSAKGQDVQRIAALFWDFLGSATPIIYLGYSSRFSAGETCSCQQLSKPFSPDRLWLVMEQVLLQAVEQGPTWARGVEAHSSSGEEIKVLLAEDNQINAKVLSTLLSDAGYRVTLARDGQEALEETDSQRFDIALVDLHMPRLDGLGFVRAYRAAEPGDVHLPIVALTVNSAEEKRDICLQAGMDGFITKPVDYDKLVALVQQYASGAA